MGKRFGNENPCMPGFAVTDGDDDRVAVTLVCLFCSKEQEIHIPRSMVSRGRVFWECLSCQTRESPCKPNRRDGKD